MRIAVIGAGIAGLGAARGLAGRPGLEVEVFEASPRAGGHACTVDLDGTPVDVGFLVYQEERYPRFTRLLAELGVASQPTDMSFSSACERCRLEVGTTSISALFAQRRRMLSRRHWRLVGGILEFQRAARRALDAGGGPTGTLADFLRDARVSDDVGGHFVLPLAAALWSAPPGEAASLAAAPILRFFADHGMLAATGAPTWRTITGGSARYVEALLARLPARVHLATPIARVTRDARGVLVDERCFDAVVMAVHADRALALLADAGEDERRALGAFRFGENEVVLHQDEAFLPRVRAARASWNHRVVDCARPGGAVEVTYDVGRLMRLGRRALVTLNPSRPPRHERARFRFAHPRLDLDAFAAREALEALQGERATWWCGAWLGAGFHEDALAAAERVTRGVLEAATDGGRGRARGSDRSGRPPAPGPRRSPTSAGRTG